MQANPLSEISLIRRLKLSQLMIFERVLETRSVVRAANEMRLTQPAVTKVIHELESCFDGELFQRSNRGVVPTELGVLLGQRVKSLMAELRYMTDELNDFRLGTSGHVIVGTLISASARLLPLAIAKLKARTPGVLVTVREGTPAHLFPALATGDVDIVVGRLPERELPIASAFPLTHEVLFEESLCAVAGGKGGVPEGVSHLADLVGSPWILPTADSPARHAAEQLFRDAGLPLPTDIVESLSLLTNIGLLLETPRIALMPRVAARQFVEAGLLRVLDLPEMGRFGSVGYSVRSNRELSAACRGFVECLRCAAGVE
jgi:DNA-binding transcriptional LysR family regulator